MNQSLQLKNAGLKSTLPRLKILDLFGSGLECHLSADDIYKKLLESGVDVGIATVYRVLTQFEQAGLLVKRHFEGDKSVFELNQGKHHDHIVCLQCGKVEEFYDEIIETRQKTIAAERGFSVNDHTLSIYADCLKADCPNKRQGIV